MPKRADHEDCHIGGGDKEKRKYCSASPLHDDDHIEWVKEPESTRDKTDDGFLHYKSDCGDYEIRFLFNQGRDIWTLHHLPTDKKWTRDGIAEAKTCKSVARSFKRLLIRERED